MTETLQKLLEEHEISLVNDSGEDVSGDLARGLNELSEEMLGEFEMMIRESKDNILQMEL